MSARRLSATLLVIVVTAALLTACQRAGTTENAAANAEPATVTRLGGGLSRITLSASGAQRIGLQTAKVRTAGTATVVPTAAVFYREDGSTWVYRQTAPLTFERAGVTIARVAGSATYVSSGPAPGTVVATVGVAELRGAEDGVPGEQ
jgi:hypothetical protein